MKTFKQVIEGMNINPDDKEEIQATNLHPGHSIKHHYPGKDKKDIPKGWHLMPDGSIMKDSDHPKEDDDIDEGLSPAQRRANRLKRMNAHLRKAMKKYGAAAKAGIHPSKVNQRRTSLTLKKR